MSDDVTFGALLGRYRARCGLSQEELAKEGGVSRNAIVLWEHHERGRQTNTHPQSRGVVLRLAGALELSKEERKGFLEAAGLSIEHWPADHWNVPFHRNPHFVGRETVLQSLRHTLVPGAKATALTQSISGLGGIGKTQVALEYTHRYGEHYEAVLWIPADSQEVATAAYLQLATQVLGLPEQHEAEQQIAEVKRWLQKRHGWLLILDNVEDPQTILSTFVPSKHRGSVLLTTRKREVGALAHSEMLPLFDEDEAILFLLRRTNRLPQKASLTEATVDDIGRVSELCQLLGNLPLALDQAGAYIAENRCPLQHYLDLYQQFRSRLLDRRKADDQPSRDKKHDDHPDSVLMTFWLSWDQIQRCNLLAGQALQFCAFLAPDQIPESLVVDAITPMKTESTRDALGMDEALGLLHRYSLIERAEIEWAKRTLSLHRLVQDVIQETLSEKERQQWMERAIFVVNAAFPNGEYGTWSQCEFLLPHVLMCAQWTLVLKQNLLEGARLLDGTGHYLYERARYREAEPLLKRAISIREEQLGAFHPDIAHSLNNLADLYAKQGRYGEAKSLHRRALSIIEEQLGVTHPDIVESLGGLANLCLRQGHYGEAEPLLKRTLTIAEEQLGAIHPTTAEFLSSLAFLYSSQGRYKEAEPLYQRALSIKEEHLGATHPSTAISLHNLARLYVRQGRYEEAEPLLKRALSIIEEQLGATHPETATSLNSLAVLYLEQSRYGEAEPLYQRALSIIEEQLGATHPNLVTSLGGLANLYLKQDRYEEAEPLLKRTLLITEEQLGAIHPNMANGLNNLAYLYMKQGRYKEAEPLYQRALTIAEAQLGLGHPRTQQIQKNYTDALRAMEGKEDP